MKDEQQPLKYGDKCPNDQHELVAAPVPSDDQRKAAGKREDPSPFPANYDTASKEQRAELGALYRCPVCGYQTRFKDAPEMREEDGAR